VHPAFRNGCRCNCSCFIAPESHTTRAAETGCQEIHAQYLPQYMHSTYHNTCTILTTIHAQYLPQYMHNTYHNTCTTVTTIHARHLPQYMHNTYHNTCTTLTTIHAEYLPQYMHNTYQPERNTNVKSSTNTHLGSSEKGTTAWYQL
jgi:glutamine amidotransferase-like uncharacterized protein